MMLERINSHCNKKILYLSRGHEQRNAINKKCHSATRPLPVGTCGASLAFGNIMNQSNPVFGGHELLVEAGFCPLLDLWPPPPEQNPRREASTKALGTPDALCFHLCSEMLPSFLPSCTISDKAPVC